MSTCRFCSNLLQHTFAALGMSPIANDYLTEEQLHCAEILSTSYMSVKNVLFS